MYANSCCCAHDDTFSLYRSGSLLRLKESCFIMEFGDKIASMRFSDTERDTYFSYRPAETKMYSIVPFTISKLTAYFAPLCGFD